MLKDTNLKLKSISLFKVKIRSIQNVLIFTITIKVLSQQIIEHYGGNKDNERLEN